MTGQKDRYATQEKLWNLDDKQTATPKHDELVLDATIDFILDRCPAFKLLLVQPERWNWGYCEKPYDEWRCKEEAYNKCLSDLNKNEYNITYIEKQAIKESPEFKENVKLFLEKSVKVSESYKQYLQWLPSADFTKCSKLLHEEPILGNNKFIIGYWDIILCINECLNFQHNGNTYRISPIAFPKIYIEVKPTIESYGATLRQVKTYMTYNNDREGGFVYILTPDIKFKSAFESQGIGVIVP